jgi:hypothetical protein
VPLTRACAPALAVVLAGCGHAYHADGTGYVEHRTSPLMLGSQPAPRPAAMAADRTISAQDCAAPIASANLRCR